MILWMQSCYYAAVKKVKLLLQVVNNEKPKLGEEIEYRISFHNTVENGKLAEVRVEDTIQKGLEYVENSIKAEGKRRVQ